jgi:PTH1 family peptidyl-tRNA hydrolase
VDPLKIFLGLGNPGTRYRSTRHNIGFRVVERLAERNGVEFSAEGELKSRVWTAELQSRSGRVVLAKPRTYMNRSGRAAVALCRHYGLTPAELVVVYDDADLQLGRIRIRPGGGSGGHNGIRSVMDVLGTGDFPRVRLGVRGVGRDESDLADYVLRPFRPEEQTIAEALVVVGSEALEALLREGLSAAMNRYNTSDMTMDTSEG